MADTLCDEVPVDHVDGDFHLPSDGDDLFSILDTWDAEYCGAPSAAALSPTAARLVVVGGSLGDAAAPSSTTGNKRRRRMQQEERAAPLLKRSKYCSVLEAAPPPKTPHVTVERSRRKQMNEHLAVLRTLMPGFYVKRGDQASIIGGVVDYIQELQQVKKSLETKKQRKVYTEQLLSPRPPLPSSASASASSCCIISLSPRPPPLPSSSSCSIIPVSPRPPLSSSSTSCCIIPVSPRMAVPMSPTTPPTPGSPYKLRPLPPLSGSNYVSPAMTPTGHDTASSSYLPSTLDAIAANRHQLALLLSPAEHARIPDVRVEFAGANLVLKTVSQRAPGQVVKIIGVLEGRSLEILHAKISAVDDTDVNAFTVKIGIECELSAEELVQEIQQTLSWKIEHPFKAGNGSTVDYESCSKRAWMTKKKEITHLILFYYLVRK